MGRFDGSAMALHMLQTTDERLVGDVALDVLEEGVASGSGTLVLCPSLAVALEAQREMAGYPNLAMGVRCETPETWAGQRWALYGDGRSLVTPALRAVLMTRLLRETDAEPLGLGDGTVEVLCQLAQRALPWLPDAEADGLSAGEVRAVEIARSYGELLHERGLVEPCEAAAALPALMAQEGAPAGRSLLLGFSDLPRAVRELALSLASAGEAHVVARDDAGPGSRALASACGVLASMAAERGVTCERRSFAGARGSSSRAPELQALVDALFRPVGDGGIVPAGAMGLLEPAGPLATDEVVCRRVVDVAAEGARRVVVVSPDVRATWGSLAPKLQARGVSVRARIGGGAAQTRVAAGFMRLAEDLARLVELDASWPEDPEAPLPDMGWWPPRDIADFLMGEVSGIPCERVWGRDARWRGDRILTPRSVIETLTNPHATSPALASAVRELLSGHVAAAAARLLVGSGDDTPKEAAPDVPQVSGEGAASEPGAEAEAEPTAVPSAEEALARAEDEAALLALGEVGRSLKAAGVSIGADDVDLAVLVRLARAALARVSVSCRPELVVPEASCEVELMAPQAAASLPPCSADALFYLGLDAVSAAIPTADGALDELLAHAGVDAPADGLAAARASFASVVRVPRRHLFLVRPARDERASETFPAVMLSEVVACYATEKVEDDVVPLLKPERASRRDEGLVEENLAAGGDSPALREVAGPTPSGRLDESLRRFVVVPRDGQEEQEGWRPSLSASQIESYLECPYKWFTLRRLGLDDCDAGFSNMEMGTFAHRVLELTHRELFLEASRKAGLVGEDCEGEPAGSLFWFDPAERVPGSRVDAGTLEHATELLRAEFAEHLAHQRLDGSTRSKQALVPHGQSEQRMLDELERDLVDTLAFESERFRGFEPRLFEGRFGGSSGLAATYAGVDLVGTIDRIDVDAEGRALVIDYKHKSALFDEYALSPRGDDEERSEFLLPRRVQTLVYASVARRLLGGTGVTVVGAVYLGTRGRHEVAGAVSARDVESVWGTGVLSERRAARVTVPVPGARSFDDLLDRTEERIAQAIERMRAGEIDARPIAADACAWCPVLDCERRMS